MIDKRTIFEIHRLKNEGYNDAGIARRLGINRRSVKKYLQNPEQVILPREKRASKLDPYRDVIDELLDEQPTVKGSVVYQRLVEAGFSGKVTIVRDYLQKLRGPLKNRQAFIRFESEPGEQMQVDWGHFGSLAYGETTRKLYALAVIESHSRMLFVEFTHRQNQAALHQGLVNAFTFFGGTPKELVVDNMMTAVKERVGSLIRFNENFLDFLRPFGIVPRACNVAAPYEKGKIENGIRYLKQNFWPLRSLVDLVDCRRQVMAWLAGTANVRKHQTTGERPIDRFKPECLRPLPNFIPDCRETVEVLVYKDFAVRFDANSYTVPPWTIGKRLILKADQSDVTIYNNQKIVARHQRCWQRKQRVELPRHREQVKKLRKKLWQDRKIAAFASLGRQARRYLEALSEANQPIKKNVIRLLHLNRVYGTESLLAVIEKALAYRAYGAQYVENILYQEMTPVNQHKPVTLKDDALNNICLDRPCLAEYDTVALKRRKHDDD